MSHLDLEQALTVAKQAARDAGRRILEVYATAFEVEEKPDDQGPVTEADRDANTLIVDALHAAFPTDGIVAEETADTSGRTRERCWWVDPLDGTREFIAHTGMFAVHIGLSIAGEAVLGVVYQPVGDRLWAGVVGQGAVLEAHQSSRPLQVAEASEPAGLRLVVSRSHRSAWTQEIQEALGITRREELGSVGLKCGRIAEGGADLYLHPSPYSYRWDGCAPEAILRASGGVLTDLEGRPYSYDGSELRNARGLVACHPAVLDRVIEVTREVYARRTLQQP